VVINTVEIGMVTLAVTHSDSIQQKRCTITR
jgi:hypothetical protein